MATTKPFVSPSFTYETMEETLDIKPKGAELFIGIPKETSFQENRVALSPDAVSVLTNNGHSVVMEANAGEGASYSDHDYSEAIFSRSFLAGAVSTSPSIENLDP